MWPFSGQKENENSWTQNFGTDTFCGDDMLQPLLKAETLPFGKLPSLEMMKMQRLYGVPDEIVPVKLAKETLRDITRLLFAESATILVNRKTGEVFITSKKIDVIENCKTVPIDSVLASVNTPPFLKSFCSFLINEILPNMNLGTSGRLSFAFLCDFDELLSVRIRSNQPFKFVNFRNLAYRISHEKIPKEEVDYMNVRLREKYKELIDLYQ